jgi:hypothetical protein
LLGLHLPDQSMMTRQILIDLKKIWITPWSLNRHNS